MVKDFFARIIEIKIYGKIRQIRGKKYSILEKKVLITMKILKLYSKQDTPYLTASESGTSPFEVLILATKNDLDLLFLNVQRLSSIYENLIIKFTIVTPFQLDKENIPINILKPRIEFKIDSDFLSESFPKFREIGFERGNWIAQQYIKTKYVYFASNPVLIVDADTFICKPLEWLRNGISTLLVNESEFHIPYSNSASKFLKMETPLLNFVSHLQLQMPQFVREIYGDDFEKGWTEWAISGLKLGESSPISEYQTYGSYSSLKGHSLIYFHRHELFDASNLSINQIKVYLDNANLDVVTVGNKLERLEFTQTSN